MDSIVDVAVIGGGINGCGIAADAALRGLSVILIEKDDIASKTSSSSSKLIHGGLRYLEYLDFSLVKKALNERQTLLNIAPHLVRPLPFVLPYKEQLRPAWVLRTGLFLYDNLDRKNKLPKSKFIKRSPDSQYFSPLMDRFNKGFLYYDCSTDDARLTLANALQAKEHGAMILPHTELIKAKVNEGLWHLTVKHKQGNEKLVHSRTVVNATGPWVESINQRLGIFNQYKMTLVKGSHLVVKKLYEGNHAYLLQNLDKRIVFIIPYFGFSMIGTTDIAFSENLDHLTISPEETRYLFKVVEDHFKEKLTPDDIITSWSGVRPLIAEKDAPPQALSRDYQFHYSNTPAPAVTIYGGKITVYRQLAVDAVNQLRAVFPDLPSSNTKNTLLPGSSFGTLDYEPYLQQARQQYHWLNPDILSRLLHTYGTKAEKILSGCDRIDDLGQHFSHGLYEREVNYLIHEEWATSCEDILWRRTKLGLCFTAPEITLLNNYLQEAKLPLYQS